jgi:hypothetical protein
VGCSRMAWNGKINEQCCRTCKSSNGACHGPECEKRALCQGAVSAANNADRIARIGICSLCRKPVLSNELRCKDQTGSYMHKGCYQGAVSAANTRQEMVHTLMSKAGMNAQDAELFLQQNNWDLGLCLQACKVSWEANAAKKAAADAAAAQAAKNAEVAAAKQMAQQLEASPLYSDARMYSSYSDARMYHATSLKAALCIQAEGFRVPNGPSQQKAGALLGPGVYASTTLQKAMKYCDGPEGGIVFELAVDLGKCKTLEENDPMMTTWQQHGYDSAWAPKGAGGLGAGLEENCIKDPKRIKIMQAIAGDTKQLQKAGFKIDGGMIKERGKQNWPFWPGK